MSKRTVLLIVICMLAVTIPVSTIHAEDLNGTYILLRDSDGTKPKDSAVVTITFTNGKVSMQALQPGETVTDTGTYSVTGNRITIRFREMEWDVTKQPYSLRNGTLVLPFKALSGSPGPGTSTWVKQDSSSSAGGRGSGGSFDNSAANKDASDSTRPSEKNDERRNTDTQDAGCQFKCLPTQKYYNTTKECQDNCKISLLVPVNAARSCIYPVCDPKAVHGPYKPMERAGVVTLDGGRSKGRNLTYEWTFKTKGCPDGISGNDNARKQGQKVNVTLLCTTDVTLTVRSGDRSARDTATITVKKRDWKMDFKFAGDTFSTDPPFIPLARPGSLQFGKSSCTCSVDSGHYIHRRDNGVWKGDVYQTKQVVDPGGPFDGFWYVSSKNMKIERRSIINADLLPSSATYKINAAAGRTADFALLLMQVRAHERIHAALVEEKLKEKDFDPAPKIEAKLRKDRDELEEAVDSVLRDAEAALEEATPEAKVRERLRKQQQFNRRGQILVREMGTSDYDTMIIPNYADLGDDY